MASRRSGHYPDSAEVEALASSVPDNGGVVLVPAFVGLGAPHWDSYARGSIHGLTRGSTPPTSHGPPWRPSRTRRWTCSMRCKDANVELSELRVDGGGARNDLLMQFQADVLGVSVVRPTVTETTALGAAYLAGLAVVLAKRKRSRGNGRMSAGFEPTLARRDRDRLLGDWRRAVERTKGWAQQEESISERIN